MFSTARITAIFLGLTLAVAALPAQAADVCGTNVKAPNPTDPEQDKRLKTFATGKLSFPDAFVNVANYLNQTGKLPDCYVTKADAGKDGWKPGTSLWSIKALEGKSIGGDNFGNKEGKLPSGNAYQEADLDYDGEAKRGAHRLVLVPGKAGAWEFWVTTDHYNSFQPVPTK